MLQKVTPLVHGLAKILAILGGIVLLAMIVLTCVSIFGRSFIFLGLAPISGDFELVEAAAAFVVFAFLPWCQINRGHAAVDIFTNFLPAAANRWIDFIAEALMCIAIIIIAWKLYDGTIAKSKYGETTFIIQYPIWWAYAVSLSAALIGCIVAIYMMFLRLGELVHGKSNSTSGVAE